MYELIKSLIQPLPILLAFCWLSAWWTSRKAPPGSKLRWLAPALGAFTWFACTPLAGYLAMRTLDYPYDPIEKWPDGCDAIVVLCGGVMEVERHGKIETAPTEYSFRRAIEAARLYREFGPKPVVVSGGRVDPETATSTEAECLADLLEQLGVSRDDLILEGGSADTYQNAVQAARLIRERSFKRVLLVTHGVHLPRARRCFIAQGVAAVPSAVSDTADEMKFRATWLVPNPGGVGAVYYAAHEWLGLIWYALSGRF